jgi:hypothetical protein
MLSLCWNNPNAARAGLSIRSLHALWIPTERDRWREASEEMTKADMEFDPEKSEPVGTPG